MVISCNILKTKILSSHRCEMLAILSALKISLEQEIMSPLIFTDSLGSYKSLINMDKDCYFGDDDDLLM